MPGTAVWPSEIKMDARIVVITALNHLDHAGWTFRGWFANPGLAMERRMLIVAILDGEAARREAEAAFAGANYVTMTPLNERELSALGMCPGEIRRP